MEEPLVTIIMPVYNAARYLKEAIHSVKEQTHSNWELLIVNDGSSDSSAEILSSLKDDSRIQIFYQENKGVSAARNVALLNMRGSYFCFLDADDMLPSNSIKARLSLFQVHPELLFADGAVIFFDNETKKTIRYFQPVFKGNPLEKLLILSDSCFAGLSWMIKNTGTRILMNETIKHGEDLLFFMECARQQGLYSYTTECVLNYRQHESSAMKNLEALERGYWSIYDYIKNWKEFNAGLRFLYRFKVKKFMFLDYIKSKSYIKAIQVLIK